MRHQWTSAMRVALLPVVLPWAVAAADLAELPVSGAQRVACAEYAAASALAADGGSPLDIALAVAGAFEGALQHIIQVNERGEAPSSAHVTVLRDGLLDDAVRGVRWDIALERTAPGAWRVREVQRAWRCWRGEHTDRFAAVACP